MALRQDTNALLESMRKKASPGASSFVQSPSSREGQWYIPDGPSFSEYLDIPQALTSLSSMPRSEMKKLSVSIPSHLLASFEHSVGMTCDAVGWLDW